MRSPRREQQAAETRDLLVMTGLKLFGGRGYAAVSAQQIVVAAGVTRGALYHHFETGKQGLFAAVFEQVQMDSAARLADISVDEGTVGDRIRSQLDAFFAIAAEPAYRRIVLEDGPSVLGWHAWRQCELRHVGKFVREAMETILGRGPTDVAYRDVAALLIYGACCEAAMVIATANDVAATRESALAAMEAMIAGLLADGGFHGFRTEA